MRHLTTTVLLCAAWAGGAFAQGGEAARLELRQSLELQARAAVIRVIDIEGDGRHEVVVFGRSGDVATWRRGEDGRFSAPDAAHLVLEHAARSLVNIADILGLGAPQLVVASPRGVYAYRRRDDGTFGGEAVSVLPRARFMLRVDEPQWADFVQDVNGDGRPDLIVPGTDRLELWVNESPANGAAASFRKAGAFHARIGVERSRRGDRLSDVMYNDFTLPRLDLRDRNGDGRADLMIEDGDRRAFHLQNETGDIPAEPTSEVDLEIFRDTTAASELKPGRTLAGGDRRRFISTDLDADGIPDYVVAHRRKIWVFRCTASGPQFEDPTQILKTAEDMTMVLTDSLDDDAMPDLLIVRIEVPTVTALIGAFFGEWDVEVKALAYSNGGGAKFSTDPTKTSILTVKLPSLRDILRNPEAILSRFEEAQAGLRMSVVTDADGDGKSDLALISKDGREIELWRGTRVEAEAEGRGDRGLLRRVFFDDKTKVWDLDRIIEFLAGRAERRIASLLEGRTKDRATALRPLENAIAVDIQSGDIDGDRAAEIFVIYEVGVERRTIVDVLGR